MAIPKPKKNEKSKDYIQRCMTDPTMIKEYKNTNQRLAICAKVYRDEQGTTKT